MKKFLLSLLFALALAFPALAIDNQVVNITTAVSNTATTTPQTFTLATLTTAAVNSGVNNYTLVARYKYNAPLGTPASIQFSNAGTLVTGATAVLSGEGEGTLTTSISNVATGTALTLQLVINTAKNTVKISTVQFVILGVAPGGNIAYTPSGGATVTLTAAQSGGTFLFDAATGVNYTLPAPAVGLSYSFLGTVSVTSNADEVQTSAGTVFLEGAIAQVGSTTTFGFAANGSSHVAYKANGTTSGGLIGTLLTFTCVSGTEWMVTGLNVASGTAGTPFTATP